MHRPDQFIRRRGEQRKGGERSTVRFFSMCPTDPESKTSARCELEVQGKSLLAVFASLVESIGED